MKKSKNILVAIITTLAFIVMLVGAAAMESESIVIPAIMTFGGLFVVAMTNLFYWRIS